MSDVAGSGMPDVLPLIRPAVGRQYPQDHWRRGPADYSIAWATGGSGPGGPVLTAFTGPEAGATSVLTAAQPVAPTRNLALALANTCGTGESLTVTKVVDNKGVTVGP